MRNLILAGIFVLVILGGVFVIAQSLLLGQGVVVNVNGTCRESDGGLNYLVAGNMSGSFWWSVGNSTNQTQSWEGVVYDACIDNKTLVEGLCGSSIHPSYSNLAGVFYVDCSIGTGNYTNSTYRGFCGAGRCY